MLCIARWMESSVGMGTECTLAGERIQRFSSSPKKSPAASPCYTYQAVAIATSGVLTRIGGVTVSTGSIAAERHAGVWAPVIACKNNNCQQSIWHLLLN